MKENMIMLERQKSLRHDRHGIVFQQLENKVELANAAYINIATVWRCLAALRASLKNKSGLFFNGFPMICKTNNFDF